MSSAVPARSSEPQTRALRYERHRPGQTLLYWIVGYYPSIVEHMAGQRNECTWLKTPILGRCLACGSGPIGLNGLQLTLKQLVILAIFLVSDYSAHHVFNRYPKLCIILLHARLQLNISIV